MPEPFKLALMLMLLKALRVSLLADHVTASLTLTSPFVPVAPAELRMVTLVVPRLVESVAPVISPPLAAML